MKATILVIAMLTAMAGGTGETYLQKIPLYQKDSYFKEKVFQDKDLEGFYAMAEPQQEFKLQGYDMHLLSAAVFYATNKLRKEKGLPQFRFSAGLRDAAVVHTNEMIQRNFFDHFNKKDKALYNPDDRIKMFLGTIKYTGENCNLEFFDPAKKVTYVEIAEKIIKSLYGSPPHKAAMLNKGYIYLGASAIFEPQKRKDGALYVKTTQDFSSMN